MGGAYSALSHTRTAAPVHVRVFRWQMNRCHRQLLRRRRATPWIVLRGRSHNWTNWNMMKSGGFRETDLFCWRPRRDLNPCYRRERAVS